MPRKVSMTSSLVYHQRSLRSCDRGFRQLRYLLRNSTPCTYEEVIACREYHNCVVDETSQRTVHVALTGAPNAGKSTLLNALVGRKVRILTGLSGDFNKLICSCFGSDFSGLSENEHNIPKHSWVL